MINLGALATVSGAISCPALDALHLGIYILAPLLTSPSEDSCILYYFYHPSMFIYRWSSNFVEKSVMEREHSGRDAILCLSYLVYRVNLSTLSQKFI